MRNGGASIDDDRRELLHERVYGVLSHDDCRRVLAALLANDGEMTRTELVSALEGTEQGQSSARARSEYSLLLTHLYLPKLERAGLVRIRGNRVRSTLDEFDHPPDLYSFIYRDRTAFAHSLRVLSVEPRRAVVEELAVVSGELHIEELAERLLTAGADDGSNGDQLSAVATLMVRLHHLHLPALDTAGLVRYDPERKTVSSTREGAVIDVSMLGARRN